MLLWQTLSTKPGSCETPLAFSAIQSLILSRQCFKPQHSFVKVFKYRKLVNLWRKKAQQLRFFTVRGGNPRLHQQRAWEVLSDHGECKQLQLSCEWPMLSAQMFLKREHAAGSHLFLAVSAGAPGVAFLSCHLHSVGQSGCCHAPSGLQAALNLRVINQHMWHTASICCCLIHMI